MSASQPLNVAAANGVGASGVAASGVEDHRRRQIAGGILSDADTADGCRRSVSPFTVDDCGGGRGALTAESLLRRQPFPQSPEFVADSRRYAAVPATSSAAVAAMMRATLDCCRPPPSSWTVGIPRHHLTPPAVTSLSVPAVAAAADLLAHLSSNLGGGQSLSSAFSPPPVNLLRF